MCYRTVSHKLRCDVRPLISDGRVSAVDSYAEPTSCGCAPNEDIKERLRCEHHGCCRVAIKIHLCADPDSCPGRVDFHIYSQVQCEVRDWTNNSVWPDAAWVQRPALDEGRFPQVGQEPGTRLRFETPLFRATLDKFLIRGRRIQLIESTVQRWLSDHDQLLNSLEGSSSDAPTVNSANIHLDQAIQHLREAIGRAQRAKDGHLSDFELAVEELQRLETWGERPVMGFHDDREWLSMSDRSDIL